VCLSNFFSPTFYLNSSEFEMTCMKCVKIFWGKEHLCALLSFHVCTRLTTCVHAHCLEGTLIPTDLCSSFETNQHRHEENGQRLPYMQGFVKSPGTGIFNSCITTTMKYKTVKLFTTLNKLFRSQKNLYT